MSFVWRVISWGLVFQHSSSPIVQFNTARASIHIPRGSRLHIGLCTHVPCPRTAHAGPTNRALAEKTDPYLHILYPHSEFGCPRKMQANSTLCVQCQNRARDRARRLTPQSASIPMRVHRVSSQLGRDSIPVESPTLSNFLAGC